MELLPSGAAISSRDFATELVESGKLVYIDSGDTGAKYLALLGPISLPVMIGGRGRTSFLWYIFSRFSRNDASCFTSENPVNSILTYGLSALKKNDALKDEKALPLIRLHSGCHTGDILGSMRCDCGPQFHEALRRIVENRCGALVYIASHEGRGIGLWAKALTYLLQDRGYDTYVANEVLGFPTDARTYGDALAALRHLLPEGRREVRLLSNNPAKRAELESGGFKVVEMRKLVVGVSNYNVNYLASKSRRGHNISSTDLGAAVSSAGLPFMQTGEVHTRTLQGQQKGEE
ncbi:MAG TPA: GTP cyclohydrolase II [Nitrososphaerales archaeon]|nr:GTP cyclohydrolase II [Nitrososphaerales archaeon]